MAGTLLPFARRLFEQAFVGVGLHVHTKRRPLGFIDEVNEALQVRRVGKPRLRTGEDVAEDARLPAERAEGVRVAVR